MAGSVKICPPGPLQVERLVDGRRKLIREFVISVDGRVLSIPRGFITDFSSWPRCLPGPAMHRIDIAGVVHDFLFQMGSWGIGGEPVTFVEANRVWYKVARAGSHKNARSTFFWSWVGRAGLFVGSWPVWLRYRKQDAAFSSSSP